MEDLEERSLRGEALTAGLLVFGLFAFESMVA